MDEQEDDYLGKLAERVLRLRTKAEKAGDTIAKRQMKASRETVAAILDAIELQTEDGALRGMVSVPIIEFKNFEIVADLLNRAGIKSQFAGSVEDYDSGMVRYGWEFKA